ncbi:MAG TPA: DUF4215 domain-containing protein [Candidatus Binatia bacterium]|nr:DUF4215 domain-containing protein [Candidatus Binatia bacterium]
MRGWLAAVGLLVAVAAAAAGDPARHALMQCQRAATAAASRFVAARARVLGRCLERALRCPAALDGGSGPDACLATVADRCRTRLGRLATVQLRLELVGPRCLGARAGAPGVALDEFLGDDGLGFELLAPFCPTVVMREDQAADASLCQQTALACAVDQALATAAPRAPELLQRLGIPVGGNGSCLVSSACGDGIVAGNEECDDGEENSDDEADACRTTCLEAFCGDGVVDATEDCDDGNRRDGDGCDGECDLEAGVCGNGITEGEEECDDRNHRDGDGCDDDCMLEPGACGNGVVEQDEECDDGNRRDGDGCDRECVPDAVCGDGVVDDEEECDDGASNSDLLADHCRTDCTEPRCGDRVIDPDEGESCEPPATLLCTDDCAWRLGVPGSNGALAAATRAAPAPLARCQRALLRAGTRAFARTRQLVDGCVTAAAHCVLGAPDRHDPTPCLARATRRCTADAARRDARRLRARTSVAAGCRAIPLERLVADPDGLGFRERAASCRFVDARPPSSSDLLACVIEAAQCLGERAVARTIPRAYELLSNLDLDPDAVFPCVDDPDAAGPLDSAWGAFIGGRAGG